MSGEKSGSVPQETENTTPDFFKGSVFYPQHLWGEESPLANYLLVGLKYDHHSYVRIRDWESLQAGWDKDAIIGKHLTEDDLELFGANQGEIEFYSPTYGSAETPGSMFSEIFQASLSEQNLARLYPFSLKYSTILPAVIKDKPMSFYLNYYKRECFDDDIEPNFRSSPQSIMFLFSHFGLTSEVSRQDALFKNKHTQECSFDKIRTKVFTLRLVLDAIKNGQFSLEAIIDDISNQFDYSKYNTISQIHAGLASLISKSESEQVLNLTSTFGIDKENLYSMTAALMTEAALLQVKYSRGKKIEHSFYHFESDDPQSLVENTYFPYLMESMAIFITYLPLYVPKGKEYSPQIIASHVRSLYNLLFKLFGIEGQLQIKPEDSLKNDLFLKKCEHIRSELIRQINDKCLPEETSAKRLRSINHYFDEIEKRIVLLESVLYMPASMRSQLNRLEGGEESSSIPHIADRLNAIRSHLGIGTDVKNSRWLLLGSHAKPREF